MLVSFSGSLLFATCTITHYDVLLDERVRCAYICFRFDCSSLRPNVDGSRRDHQLRLDVHTLSVWDEILPMHRPSTVSVMLWRRYESCCFSGHCHNLPSTCIGRTLVLLLVPLLPSSPHIATIHSPVRNHQRTMTHSLTLHAHQAGQWHAVFAQLI